MTCTMADCVKNEFARGWCHMHWNRWRRNGDPLTVLVILDNEQERIRSKIDQTGGPDACWPWTGTKNDNGYGRAVWERGKTYAHRAAYMAFVGPIPHGHDIDHQCHNRDPECPGGWGCSHRACCNPAHLEPATRSQNMLRANARIA